jgi:hypothetical protein
MHVLPYQYDGEKDSKGPSDFGNSRPDDGPEGEDDEVEDDEDSPSRPKKRTDVPSVKPSASKPKPSVKSDPSNANREVEVH